MSEPRSPRDRLRAIRAGRVSQLLSSSPDDGLPPTEPPRLKLNGKPVTAGAAFDAVMARAHGLKVDAALDAVVAKTGHRLPKDRPTYPTGTPPINPLAVQMYQAALKAASTAAISATSPLYDGLDDQMARQREDQTIRRAISDELADLTHLLQLAPSNDNQRLALYLPVELDTTLRPQPASSPELPGSYAGPLLDDPDMRASGKTPPFLGESFQVLGPLPPKDWDEFNRPQKEPVPILEVDWRNLILYHNSSPETEQDTTFVINTLKKLLIEFGFTPAEDWGERERERYFPGPDGGRKGSRYADAAVGVRIGDKLYVINANTISVLKDGTPTRYERNAETDLNEKIRTSQEEHTPSLLMIRKSRGMPRADWEIQTEEGLRRFLRTWIDSLVK